MVGRAVEAVSLETLGRERCRRSGDFATGAVLGLGKVILKLICMSASPWIEDLSCALVTVEISETWTDFEYILEIPKSLGWPLIRLMICVKILMYLADHIPRLPIPLPAPHSGHPHSPAVLHDNLETRRLKCIQAFSKNVSVLNGRYLTAAKLERLRARKSKEGEERFQSHCYENIVELEVSM